MQALIPACFFAADRELAGFPALTASTLASLSKIIAHAFALRFALAGFRIVEGPIPREMQAHNVLAIQVDPALERLRLPTMLIMPKVAGAIKNIMRLCYYRHAAPGAFSPVQVKIEAIKRTDNVWELRVSDTGRGIIVEELFGSLANQAKLHPKTIPPHILQAIRQWEGGILLLLIKFLTVNYCPPYIY